MRLSTSPVRLARIFVAPVLALAFLASAGVASADTTADLAITNPAVGYDHSVGSSATYTMQVSNNGPDATDATVSDQLGDAEDLISAETTQGSCTQAVPVSCSLGTVAPGAPVTVTIKVNYARTAQYNQH